MREHVRTAIDVVTPGTGYTIIMASGHCADDAMGAPMRGMKSLSLAVLAALTSTTLVGTIGMATVPDPQGPMSRAPLGSPGPLYHECNPNDSKHEVHTPIRILGDANFTTANGVVRGSGTASDPYVIEDWLIFPDNPAGIIIENTSAHFVIRDVDVCYGRPGADGIRLEGVSGARIEHATLRCNDAAIVVVNSTDVQISDVYVPGQVFPCHEPLWEYVERGVLLADSAGITLTRLELGDGRLLSGVELLRVADIRMESLRFYAALESVRGQGVTNLTFVDSVIPGPWGVILQNATRVVFERNFSTWNAYGIRLVSSDNATVRWNRFGNHGGGGVSLESSSDVVVESNGFWGPGGTGVYAQFSRRVLITNNTFKEWTSGVWVWLRDSSEFRIYHNQFGGSEVSAEDDGGPENRWDDGYPSGGNHWSDYTGVDEMSGPNQDLPGPDGIGDTPYVIDPDSRDHYPLAVTLGFSDSASRAPVGLPSDTAEMSWGRNLTIRINQSEPVPGIHGFGIPGNPPAKGLSHGLSFEALPWGQVRRSWSLPLAGRGPWSS